MKYDYTSCQSTIGMNSHPLVFTASFLQKGKLIADLDSSVIAAAIDWLDIPQQWNKTEGEGVKIAVLDSGVVEHKNLEGAVVEAVDCTGSEVGVVDTLGHGTHVVGIIAARRKEKGIVGIAPQALIYSAKVLGESTADKIEALVKGIYWAIEKQVHLISISWVCNQSVPALKEAIQAAAQAGIFIISAVGNEGKRLEAVYPASYPEVLGVGAVSLDARVAPYSNQGSFVDVVAPGKFTSTYLKGQYMEWEGTSMAVACVTGVVALLLGWHFQKYGYTPLNTAKDLKNHLIESAIDLGKVGRDDAYGYGLVHPSKILQTRKFDRHIGKSIKASKTIPSSNSNYH